MGLGVDAALMGGGCAMVGTIVWLVELHCGKSLSKHLMLSSSLSVLVDGSSSLTMKHLDLRLMGSSDGRRILTWWA